MRFDICCNKEMNEWMNDEWISSNDKMICRQTSVTFPISTKSVSITMILLRSCQTIRQKSATVAGRQPWLAMYSALPPDGICNTHAHTHTHRATERHLPYEITQCYLPQMNMPHLKPSQAGWYSIYLPRRDGRLSWPWCRLYTEMVYLSVDRNSSKFWQRLDQESNSRPLDRKSNVLSVMPPNHLLSL